MCYSCPQIALSIGINLGHICILLFDIAALQARRFRAVLLESKDTVVPTQGGDRKNSLFFFFFSFFSFFFSSKSLLCTFLGHTSVISIHAQTVIYPLFLLGVSRVEPDSPSREINH